ncbi:MAG: DNA polymerase III [Patescibacteria group bacterium]|nr:MAG: DNA polymerase III [Patescibacteria group bacterium]
MILLYLKKHKSNECDFWVSLEDYFQELGIKKSVAERINKNLLEQNYYTLLNQIERLNIRVITFWEKDYPKHLLNTADFPLLLFTRGEVSLLQSKAIAVVGTRKMTSYGEMVTRKLVEELVDFGYTIVSGCMYGVDEVAHREAIRSRGKTIAVLGYGLAVLSPQQTLQDLVIANGGCAVTEYLPSVSANKGTFPERNRIVAGLSSGVLVTEAALKSGTHITVDFALEAGREIFAIPGSILNPYTEGTKYLLNQGATLVSSGADIVAELEKAVTIPNSARRPFAEPQLDETAKKIVSKLHYMPLSTDELVKETNLTIQELLTALGMLELENIVENKAGLWRCMV